MTLSDADPPATNDRPLDERYDASYYAHHCSTDDPLPYERSAHWLGFFGNVADRIRSDIAPATTLDVGCAHGFLVEALTDRGVDANGFDVSEFAISQVRDDVKPRCWVGSVLEPIPGHYDLVTCFEVLEHLEVEGADRAVANLCTSADDILFSSTPIDFREETHVNVRPSEFWAELFARHGFMRDVGFDASFVAWWAVRYRRARDPWYRLVADYEREQWRLRHEAQERNSVVLSQMDQIASELDRIAALERRVDELSGESLQPELERLTRQLSDSHTLLVEANLELSDSHTLLVEANLELQEYHTFRRSAEVRAAVKVGARMRRLLPAGTRRRRAAKAAAHGAMHPQQVVRGLGRRLTGRGRSSVEVAGMDAEYRLWLVANEPSPTQLTSMRETSREFPVRPLISIAVPVHDPEASWLLDAITSVRAQAYENWELCIADDASAKPHVRQILESEAAADPRIKVTYRATNGGIAEASNSALGMATGEFVAFLDHDDVLRPHALFQVVTRIDQCPEADILYSDEDKILLDGSRGSVFFKPNWSPAWLLSQNYITHLLVVRRRLLTDLGGFRTGYDGSQDHDLLLRLTEKTDRIEHIADVLYSWRQVPGSAALSGDAKPLARLAGRQCVEDALRRRGTPGHVELGPSPGVYDIRYELMARPKVSVIIPTRDRVDLLERCLSGIDSHTTYPDLEVIIVDNDSRQPATHEFFANCGHRVVAAPGPFNYSRIVNVGVRSTSTPYAVLLNNDVAVMTPDWIERLLELCQQPDIGVVGCQLRFRDGRMQHAGIGIGYGHLGYNLPMDWPVVRDAAAVTGACMMFKREAFDQVQGFDEKMGVAFNDVDFCLRIRQLGLRVVYTPFRMEHEESSSRGRLNPSADQDAFRARWGGEDTLVDPFLSPHILWPDAGRIRLGSA